MCVVTVKIWKQSRYPSTGEWLNNDTSIPWNTTKVKTVDMCNDLNESTKTKAIAGWPACKYCSCHFN